MLPDAEAIALAIGDARRTLIDHIDVFESIDSTSTWLMQATPPAAGRFRIAVAGQQTSGRGRRGRRWLSPPGAGLYLSVCWSTATPLDRLQGATLVIGTCVAGALEEIGVDGIALKWPNDVMLNDGKLGGILTESRASHGDATTIVTGIGINLDISAALNGGLEPLDIAVSDLASVLRPAPALEELAGVITASVIDGFQPLESGDFDDYLERWMARDWLRGKSVTVDGDAGRFHGVCSGVDATGALLLESGNALQRVVAGSVQLDPPAERAG